ncbi:MAG: radical SAM family heme chaperone HemW [Clostridia bacterium]|nr:radical SAM family heme chaperone HemW [Clostridia bacterium]
MKKLGLYVHIPFCRSKCLYCDFCSFPNRAESDFTAYVDALCRDLRTTAARCTAHTVETVYFGGGTPTLLPPTLLNRILSEIFACYRVSPDAEITLECNPATATKQAFSELREAGFNRISIGLQSADERELRALGRLHSFADFERTFREAREAGFSNISADVMLGIPHQTKESHLQTLAALAALAPEHISAYGLTVESDTPFGKMGDRLVLPDEETSREMYFEGAQLLEKLGYRQYEISNFAKTGYESRHNLKYWNCEEYLGFGPAAYSDFGGTRFGNSRDLSAYLEGKSILAESESPSLGERAEEYIMLRLRLAEGVDCQAFANRFGFDFDAKFGKTLRKYVFGGFVKHTQNKWALTREGFYVSNTILSELLDFSS